ncbi:MAG: tetratricopeptide repeat protein, partial [Burkholderiales bacterium]
ILDPQPELYDLQRDPQEKTNLMGRYPADADRLLKHIWEVAGEESRQEKVIASPVDTETRQELESLGYVSAGTPREIRLGTHAADPKDRLGILKDVEQAEEHLAQGRYARAAQLMEDCVKRDPANPLVHIYQSAAYNRLGHLEREIAVYQHALQMGIETDQIYSRLGKAYLRAKRLDKAVEALSRGSVMNPLDLDALNHLGVAYYRLDRIDDAERAFRAVIIQNDRNGAAYDGLGLVAVRRGDAPSAQRYFEKALEVDASQVDPLLNLGMLFQVTGRKELAVEYYKKFLEKASKEEYGAMFPGVRKAIRECTGK